MIAQTGLEGGGIYALSCVLRDAIMRKGPVMLQMDLRPDVPADELAQRLSRPRGSQSLSSHLRKAAGLSPIAAALLREAQRDLPDDPQALAALIKNMPLSLLRPRPLERAISSAGGLAWDEVDEGLMLRRAKGLFVCGEMLDWEAPTGGYLLQACFATGFVAGRAAARYVEGC
jgi:predicted flavoprotein YhiN